MEFAPYKHSLIGTPQGSVLSPILCNIYMDKLDKHIEKLKAEFDVGSKASRNPEWVSYQNKKLRAKTLSEKIK